MLLQGLLDPDGNRFIILGPDPIGKRIAYRKNTQAAGRFGISKIIASIPKTIDPRGVGKLAFNGRLRVIIGIRLKKIFRAFLGYLGEGIGIPAKHPEEEFSDKEENN